MPQDSADAPTPWPAATALAGMPGLVETLLRTHVDDGRGRCRACRSQVRAAAPWPCSLYRLATAATR